MVFFGLKVQCNFEGIKLLYVNISDYDWCLKVKCTSCGEVSGNWHTFNSRDSNTIKSGRGTFNFVYKCKLCSRENSIDVVQDSLQKLKPITGDAFVQFVKFDCRGLEPIAFQAKDRWIAEAENSDAVFRNIDLSENDWADYDQKTNETVGIYDFSSKFERVK